MTTAYPSAGAGPDWPAVESIEDVPVYRRSWFATILVVGAIVCVLLLWWVCILCLTGDIYRNKVRADGRLSRWSRANKVAAALILVLQAVFYMWRFERYIDQQIREKARSVILIEKKWPAAGKLP
jgi:hypothetical protein